jgi:hypothetical protein
VRLVVDANIAQSAGTSNVPESIYSRECLNAVRDSGHVAVFCQQLLDEWGEHASLVSRRWWKSMAARRRIERFEGEQFAILQDRACACLVEEKRRVALEKDFHLVRAALATDRSILSNETEFPKLLAMAAASISPLAAIVYGNPAIEEEACVEWIKAGAMPAAARMIGAWGDTEEN